MAVEIYTEPIEKFIENCNKKLPETYIATLRQVSQYRLDLKYAIRCEGFMPKKKYYDSLIKQLNELETKIKIASG